MAARGEEHWELGKMRAEEWEIQTSSYKINKSEK